LLVVPIALETDEVLSISSGMILTGNNRRV
jgi:hypothetical protein